MWMARAMSSLPFQFRLQSAPWSRWAPQSELHPGLCAAPGQFGNVGRNAILGPGIIGFDAEVQKQFRMPYSEHHTVQFLFEAFNAMNHPSWNMPSLNILSGAVRPGLPGTAAHANFGVVTGTSVAVRQFQLGPKYSF